jgi:hypothetical protein
MYILTKLSTLKWRLSYTFGCYYYEFTRKISKTIRERNA